METHVDSITGSVIQTFAYDLISPLSTTLVRRRQAVGCFALESPPHGKKCTPSDASRMAFRASLFGPVLSEQGPPRSRPTNTASWIQFCILITEDAPFLKHRIFDMHAREARQLVATRAALESQVERRRALEFCAQFNLPTDRSALNHRKRGSDHACINELGPGPTHCQSWTDRMPSSASDLILALHALSSEVYLQCQRTRKNLRFSKGSLTFDAFNCVGGAIEGPPCRRPDLESP